jgi:hypothetical protein
MKNMLCNHIKFSTSTELLALVPHVERIELEIPPSIAFLVTCRGCGTVHSQEVSLDERPCAYESPIAEFFAWLAREAPNTAYKKVA